MVAPRGDLLGRGGARARAIGGRGRAGPVLLDEGVLRKPIPSFPPTRGEQDVGCRSFGRAREDEGEIQRAESSVVAAG